MDLVVQLVVIVVLTLLEGFFVASEIALVSIRRSRVDQLVDEGSSAARRVRRLLDDPGRFLAVAQLGLTTLGFFASAFAAVSLVDGLSGLLARVDAFREGAPAIALVIVTTVLALFTIVFAELVPKTLALAHTERYALTLSRPIELIARLLGPVVSLLTGMTQAVTRALGARVSADAQISAEELKLIVERGGEQGVLEAEEEQMINAVIELGERRVHEVMVPRTDIVGLEVDGTFEEAVDRIIAEGHSRLPVWERSVDEVVGILYAKDLLRFLKEASADPPPIRALLRAPVFVPESITIDDLLHELQRRKVHLAVVLDEYGGTAGLVTIEDLLEEIVGEIQDEYDEEEPMVVRLDNDRARIDGRASVDELGEVWDDLDLDALLEDREEYDTLGGLLFHRIGGVPVPGDRIRVGALTLTVESTDGRRVGKILAVREPEAGTDGEVDQADR
ncbi:MAG: hemolysin family protein [Candidatus Limnocylindrales bacterium]|jgi:putative hemolysin|nr:hemolysin family protein [Candidatus Limnocylindrales bacterium]